MRDNEWKRFNPVTGRVETQSRFQIALSSRKTTPRTPDDIPLTTPRCVTTPRCIPAVQEGNSDCKAKALEKRLRELKMWGQRLVDARSEEESFLLDALADAKTKRAASKDNSEAVGVVDENKNPLLLEDATWKQREEILKMLFRKINERGGDVQTAKHQIALRVQR